jgi:hypothetical protein
LGLLPGRRAAGATAAFTTPFAALAGRAFIAAGARIRGLCNLYAFALRGLFSSQAGKRDGIESGE